jgi:hypothetical protein
METDAAEARSRSGLRRSTLDLSSKAKNKEQKGRDAHSLGQLEDGGHSHGLLEQQIRRMHHALLELRIRSGKRATTQAPKTGTGGEGGRLCVREGGRQRREEDDCVLGSQRGHAGATGGDCNVRLSIAVASKIIRQNDVWRAPSKKITLKK